MTYIQRGSAIALFFAAAAMSGTPAARGQTVGPVPAATIINSVPYTISAPGFYQVGANLTYNGNGSTNDAIITVNANNVTLDLGGHYLSGPSTNTATTLFGVYASGKGVITIQNGTISHCYEGIYLTGSNSNPLTNVGQTIRNVLVTHCYYIGVELDSPGASRITDCEVSFIGGTTVSANVGPAIGIRLASAGPGCQVNHNTVASVSDGEYAGSGIIANAGSITGNTVDTVTAYGIGGGSLVVGNKVSNCVYGLYNPTKYQNNLTYGCTYSFYGGTDAGGNN